MDKRFWQDTLLHSRQWTWTNSYTNLKTGFHCRLETSWNTNYLQCTITASYYLNVNFADRWRRHHPIGPPRVEKSIDHNSARPRYRCRALQICINLQITMWDTSFAVCAKRAKLGTSYSWLRVFDVSLISWTIALSWWKRYENCVDLIELFFSYKNEK